MTRSTLDIITNGCEEGWPYARAFLLAVDVDALACDLEASVTAPFSVGWLFRLMPLRALVAKTDACAWGDFVVWLSHLSEAQFEFLSKHLPYDTLDSFLGAAAATLSAEDYASHGEVN